MKIRNFISYLEGLRDDEFSHLNDHLSGNNEKKTDYNFDDDSTRDYGDYDDWYDDDSTKEYANKKNWSTYDDYDDDDDYDGDYDDKNSNDVDDNIQHLTYLLRQMFKNSGVDGVLVTAKNNEEILVEVQMKKDETLKNVIRVFEVANKLKRDILAQYDSEFDIWSSRQGGSVLAFGFTLDEGLEDDNFPF